MPAHAEEIAATFDRMAEAWKTNDGAAVAGFFTEDGSIINPFGERADGREAVGAMYAEYFGGMLRGTATTVAVTSVRPVGPDHAFVDAEQTITGPDGAVVLPVRIAALMRRDGGIWRIVDGRPSTVAPPQ